MEILNYTMTETMKEHRSLAFASAEQTSEEPLVQLELLWESADITTVLQHVQQGHLLQILTCYDGTLHFDEGNKRFEMNTS